MTAATDYAHIVLTEDGVAMIEGTTTRVDEVVLDFLAGDSAQEIHFQYPYLSLSRIYSALAFYYDHQPAVDAEIARRRSLVEDFKARSGPSLLREKLRRDGERP